MLSNSNLQAYLESLDTERSFFKTHKWPDYDVHPTKRTTIKNLEKQKDQDAHSSAECNLISAHQLMQS
jgi:hypothetical protein